MRPKNQQGEEGTFKMSCDRRLVVFNGPVSRDTFRIFVEIAAFF